MYSGFPHGIYSIYAVILGVSSSVLAISSSWGCYFVAVDFVFLNNSPDEFDDRGGMTMGLLSYEDTTMNDDLRCVSYSTTQMEAFDGSFRAARACAIGANILLGLSALVLSFMSCVVVRSSIMTLLSVALVIGGVLEGFTFLIFLSDFTCKDCHFFFGSALALLCAIVAVFNGVIVWHMRQGLETDQGDTNTDDNSFDQKRKASLSTPRFLGSKTSTSDDIDVPGKFRACNQDVVLVLPDGRKQVIEPTLGSSAWCGADFSVFPRCST